jgi:aminoglycoside phosphotransferase (APT) family kinase protein
VTETPSRAPWAADVEIDPGTAAALLAEACPAWRGRTIRPLGSGWDNVALEVDGAWVVRLPRRRLAEPWILHESDVLPVLAPLLPLPVPVPAFVGLPGEGFPFYWAGHRKLPGVTACGRALDDQGRAALAEPLGAFLRVLHGLPGELVDDPPDDEIGRADHRRRGPRTLDLAERLGAGGLSFDLAGVRAAVEEGMAATPWAGEPCWVHGDLYARHLLLDESDHLCGVIDWGDVHRGDPALDLSIVWSFLPGSARERFLRAYGEVDPGTRARARQRAAHYGVILLDYAQGVSDHDLRREAGEILRLVAE